MPGFRATDAGRSTLAVVVPHWNWFRFPTGYLGQGTAQIVGGALAGLAIAFVLRTRGT